MAKCTVARVRHVLYRSLAGIGLFVFSAAAYGQQTAQPPLGAPASEAAKEQKDDDVLTLPPVSVTTARRKEENLQEVPISITYLSQDMLRNNNAFTVNDLQFFVPSLSVNSSNDGVREGAMVTIRGQGVSNIGGQPAVAMYINQVPLPTTFNGSLAGGPGLYFDLENVQVLKGPQGTLFGRNSVGGAILLQSARPTENAGGHAQLTYGNFNDREVDVVFNIPLISKVLLARIAYTQQTRDGTTFVLSSPKHPNGFDADNRDFWAARGSLTWNPTPNFRNDTIVTYSSYESNGTATFLSKLDPAGFIGMTYPKMVISLKQQQAYGRSVHVPIDHDTDETDGRHLTVQNISRFNLPNGMTFQNIIGYVEAKTTDQADIDGTDSPWFALNPRYLSTNVFTEEAQLFGKAFGEKLDWTAGIFYLDQKPPNGRYMFQSVSVLETILPGPIDSYHKTTSTSTGYYLSGVYELAPKWSATAGIRHTSDSIFNSSGPTKKPADLQNFTSDSSAITGNLGLDYRIAPEKLLYFAARRGYRAGGNNSAPTFRSFAPEYLYDFELGLKADWKVGGIPVRANFAVYYDLYEDIQVTQQIPGKALGEIITVSNNAASAKVFGTEFEVFAQVTKNFDIGASLSTLDFKYTKFLPGVDGPALAAGSGANRVPFQYGVSARYFLPINRKNQTLSVQAHWHWRDSCTDFLGTNEVPAYGLLNLAANWNNVAGLPIDLSLFVSNAADKEYTNGGIGFLGWAEQTWGEPRFYGMRLRYNF